MTIERVGSEVMATPKTGIRKTRKTHTCWHCDDPIDAGTDAYFHSDIDPDYGRYTAYLHPECQEKCATCPLDDYARRECTGGCCKRGEWPTL